jgi:hypothetical protein
MNRLGKRCRVSCGGGISLEPSISWSKKGEGESTGWPFDEGEMKRSQRRAVSATRARRGRLTVACRVAAR